MLQYRLLFFIVLLVNTLFSQVFFFEDFEGQLNNNTNLPLSWQKTGLSKDGMYKVGDSSTASYFLNNNPLWVVPSHTKFAYTCDVSCSYQLGGQSCDKSQDRLISPIFDFTSINKSIVLDFETYFTGQLGAKASVEYSLDNGGNWIKLYDLHPSQIWENNHVDISSLKGKGNVLLSFKYNDGNGLKDGFAIDNVKLTKTNPWVDLSFLSTDLVKYTNIPSTQLIPLPLKFKFVNNGSIKSDSSTFSLTIWSGINRNKILKTVTQKKTNINAKDTIEFDFGTIYSNQITDNLDFSVSLIDVKDTVLINNKFDFIINISQNEYARDNGSFVNTYDLLTTSNVIIGNIYEIKNETYIDSVEVNIDKSKLSNSSSIQALVFKVDNQIPQLNPIGVSSLVIVYKNDTLSKVRFKITDNNLTRLKLDTGNYLIAINKFSNGENLGVKMSDEFFSENAVYVKIGSANFQSLETYYSGSYNYVPSIRMFCSPFCNVKLKVIETKANCATSKGSLTAVPLNASYPYSFYWNNQLSDSILSNVSVGKYSFSITDKFGCKLDTTKINLGYSNKPRITVDSVSYPTCYGYNDGFISINVIDENPLTKIYWNNEQTNTIFHTNLKKNNYLIKVFNNQECFDTVNVTLDSPDSLFIKPIITDETLKSKGEIFVSVSGGTQPYSFNWSDSIINTNIRKNLIGDKDYEITVTDTNKCKKTLKLHVNKILNVIDNQLDNGLIYYNQINNSLIINNGLEVFDFELLTTEGVVILKDQCGVGDYSYELNHVASGMYILRILTKNKQYSIRIIVY